MKHKIFLFLLSVIYSLSAFSQNKDGWEFASWHMRLKQVQDSLYEKQIDYTYSLHEGKQAFIKVSVAEYQGWAADFFFLMETQQLYQVTTKKKFILNEIQKAEKELENVSDYMRENWGAPVKEVTDKSAPFCQYEYVWELEKTKITINYCKTSSIGLNVIFLAKK
jgi:hypothetical protein